MYWWSQGQGSSLLLLPSGLPTNQESKLDEGFGEQVWSPCEGVHPRTEPCSSDKELLAWNSPGLMGGKAQSSSLLAQPHTPSRKKGPQSTPYPIGPGRKDISFPKVKQGKSKRRTQAALSPSTCCPELQRKLPVSLSTLSYLPQSIPRETPGLLRREEQGGETHVSPLTARVLRMATWKAQGLHNGKTHTLPLNPFQAILSIPRHAPSPGHHPQSLSIGNTLSAVFISEVKKKKVREKKEKWPRTVPSCQGRHCLH